MATQTDATFQITNIADAELAAAARKAGLSMSVVDLRELRERLGRDPSIVEAYAFDAQWSEHCSYKSSRPLLKKLPVTGPDVLLGPAEDAGVLRLGEWNGDVYGIVVAHESHNHPSQIVPFEGAATGIGGIVRDVLCMGASLIGVADPLRFGDVERDDAKGRHAKYVARRAVAGIGAYGNAIGVPNLGGDIQFHDGFDDNCLVNVVALGVLKAADLIHSAAPEGSDGWDIILVGKATDRSGFGGAAFSSLVLDADDVEGRRGAVQVPDPFLKNVVMRASYRVFEELRSSGRTAGFKDLGAGGIMGCTAEIVAAGGMGAIIDLDRVSLAQPGLPPAVIAVGETQERLTWVVPRDITPRVLAIYNEEFSLPMIAQGAGAFVIGRVTSDPSYIFMHEGQEVMNVPIDILTGDLRRPREAGTAKTAAAVADVPVAVDVDVLTEILAHRDVCSRRPVIERYDGVVRGATAVPAGYADAGVIVPVPGAPLGMAISVDGNARYGVLDARAAAALAVVESMRNVTAVGARPIGLTDCLNFGNPERPEHQAELVAAIDGLAEAARGLNTAFVSGNVSLYNEASDGRPVPASAIVGCVGAIEDISQTVTATLSEAGSSLYLIGARQSALGGSVVAQIRGLAGAALPKLEYPIIAAEMNFVRAQIENGNVSSCHDISDGGMLTAIAEMTFAFAEPGTIGAEITVDAWPADIGSAAGYFGETGGFVVEIGANAVTAFTTAAQAAGVAVMPIGRTTAEPKLCVAGRTFAIAELFTAWDRPLTEIFS